MSDGLAECFDMVDELGRGCTLLRYGDGGVVTHQADDVPMIRLSPQGKIASLLDGGPAQFEAKFAVRASDLSCYGDCPRKGDRVLDQQEGRIYTVENPEALGIEAGAVGGWFLWARGH
jgi:hypothetical protein